MAGCPFRGGAALGGSDDTIETVAEALAGSEDALDTKAIAHESRRCGDRPRVPPLWPTGGSTDEFGEPARS